MKADETVDPKKYEQEAELLRVLGHPVRLAIVVNLLDSACCVKDMWSCLGLPQATVSQHLSALRAKGIVTGRRDGNTITYDVVDPFVRDFVKWYSRARKES